MIAETGHYALILALAVAVVQTILPLWGTRARDPQLMAIAVPAAQAQFLLIAVAFSALTTAYVTSDFSLQNVWANSHSAKPMLYKISGVWGNHEGSMVLWVLILALFGAAVATYGTNLPKELQANVLAIQGSIAAGFSAVHHHHVQPLHADRPGALRRPRAQPRAARPGARLPPAISLRGLCRLLDGVLVRHRRPDRRARRRGLGALGAALDARCLDVPHPRHRHGLLVGLLRARLGRVLVLGPGRERLLHALARRDGAAAFGARHGEARRAEGAGPSCSPSSPSRCH